MFARLTAVAALGLCVTSATAQDFGEKTLRLGDIPATGEKTLRLGDVPTSGLERADDLTADLELIGRFCGIRSFGCYRPCFSYARFCAPRVSYCNIGYYRPSCYRPSYCYSSPSYYYSTPSYYYSTPSYYYSTPSYYYSRPAFPISIQIGGASFGGSSSAYPPLTEPLQRSQPMPPATDDGTYPYNGGPSSPVPQPRPNATPPLPKDEVPSGGRIVSLPSQPSKFAYPAYGETAAPTGFASELGSDPVRTVRK